MPFSNVKLKRKRLSSMGLLPIDDLISMEELKTKLQNLEVQLCNSRKENSKLLSNLQNCKGNILVYTRVRPEVKMESVNSIVDIYNDTSMNIKDEDHDNNKAYLFDHCFSFDSNQEEVFNEFEHLSVCVIDGYQVAVIAYGQTGSGKTYTMIGEKGNYGLFFNLTNKILSLCEELIDCVIKISMYEIYNEEVYDLLSAKRNKMNLVNSEEGITANGISEKFIKCNEDILKYYKIGSDNRSTASTNMNEYSSRSHCILLLTVEHKINNKTIIGRINLVDLAGSERIEKSGASGGRLIEAQNINKSLSALGDVISALDSKQKYIPYRNSKLTYALKDALSPGSKTIMICTMRNDKKFIGETLSTLNFASRIRKVNLGSAKKLIEYKSFEDENGSLKKEISSLKKELQNLQKENNSLKSDKENEMQKINQNREKNEKQFKIQIKELSSTIEENNSIMKSLKNEIKKYKSEIERMENENEKLRDENKELNDQLTSSSSKSEDNLKKLKKELKNLQSEKESLESQIEAYEKEEMNKKKLTSEETKKLKKQLEESTEEMKLEIDSLKKEMKTLKKTNTSLKSDNESLTKENETIQKKLSATSTKLESVTKEKEKLTKANEKNEEKIKKLQSAVKTATKNPVKVHNNIATRRATMTGSTLIPLPTKNKSYKKQSLTPRNKTIPEAPSFEEDDTIIPTAEDEENNTDSDDYIDFEELGIPISDFNEDIYNYYFEVVETDENNNPVEY